MKSTDQDGAVFHVGKVNVICSIAIGLITCMTGLFFSLRTEIDRFTWIEREVRNSEETWLGIWSLPAVDAILEALKE